MRVRDQSVPKHHPFIPTEQGKWGNLCSLITHNRLGHLAIQLIEGTELASVEVDQGNIGAEVPPLSRDEHATKFRTLGFAVDDDNDPAPENVPTLTATHNKCTYAPWNSVPFCNRQLSRASALHCTVHPLVTVYSILLYY